METDSNQNILFDAFLRFASIIFSSLSLLITVYLWNSNESILRGCLFVNCSSIFTSVNLMRTYPKRYGIFNFTLNTTTLIVSTLNFMVILFLILTRVDCEAINFIIIIIIMISTCVGFLKELRIAITDFKFFSEKKKTEMSHREEEEGKIL